MVVIKEISSNSANGNGGKQKQQNRPRTSRSRDPIAGQTAIQIHQDRAQRRPKMVKLEKPRQEICALLKWSCFLINFLVFLASVGCLALGLYLFVNDPRPIAELADFFLNPAVLLASIGLVSGVVTLFGLFGSLRDNVFLLKLFALCVFLAYLLLVVCTCLLFLMFYSDATGDTKGISAQSLLLHSISRYHVNKNVADFVDYLQEQLECCGSTTFRDWQWSEQFNCNATNPYPERCGVPFSCCRRSVAGSAGGGQNPLAPAIRSIQCWQNAQKKREQELDSDIYVAGCLHPLRAIFDAHALHIGLAVVSVILPVCLGVCLSQCLARQIDYQHYLLQREQRRRDRRERRYMGQEQKGQPRKKSSISSQSGLMERGEMPVRVEPMGERLARRRSPPKVPPPPTPRNDAEAAAMAAAIKASKQEWEKEQQRRRQQYQQQQKQVQHGRAASFSPLRNVTLRKEENNRNGKNNKRKSMTLETAEQMDKRQKKELRNNKKAAKKQKEGQLPAGPSKNAIAAQQNVWPPKTSRAEPSAPPLFLTLQQHHFN